MSGYIGKKRRNTKKSIVEKCKEEPKLFYRFVNGKVKQGEGIKRLRVREKLYEQEKKRAE